jgi:hypothetical protein
MGGIAFHNSNVFSKEVGEAAANNIMILTTKWETPQPREVLERRQRELEKHFESLIEAGAVIKKYNQRDDPVRFVELVGKST